MIYDHPLVGWVYGRSPIPLQNAMVSGYGLLQRKERLSPSFRRILAELEKTERWGLEELEALQALRLQKLICHAYENVPYYRRVFEERRLTPSDIRTPDDLYKLPILTKQSVRRHAEELRARNVPRYRYRVGRTGGSTGIPLKVLLDRHCILFDHALIHRHWSWARYRPGDRVVLLRGLTLVPADEHQGTYWRFDWGENKIYLSGFHLSSDVMPLYVEKLQQWRPKFIAGYPSSMFTLARFMQHENVRIPVQAIFTSSEKLSGLERRVIEQQFECRVWDRYGTGERLVVTQQCEYGAYHQNAEFGVLQVDSPLGGPACVGQKGMLILTGLTNYSMPLIRYAIEDVGSRVVGDCPCGRKLPMAGIVDGRKDDVIVTAESRVMPRAGLDQIHEFVENIERCQLVQKKIGEVIIRVQARPGFNNDDSAELVRQLRKRLGAGTIIGFEVVEKLELTATGKQRFIVSEVDIDSLAGIEAEALSDNAACSHQ
jgi:phenylacetate-coenzyme A ligase PaaK-like adenylate-forming protein